MAFSKLLLGIALAVSYLIFKTLDNMKKTLSEILTSCLEGLM
jgi:hypothetical protein